MADTRKFVKVFLGSPGDLSSERQAAKQVVDEINSLLGNVLGYHVELVGWEDTVSGFGRPQAIINSELERCELFVGIMWKKWGTKPSTDGPYSSGFEEEFRISMDRRTKHGTPEISLLFKHVADEFLRDPGDDLKKVLAFKDELIGAKAILFENFTDLKDFEGKLRRCITTHITRLYEAELAKVSDQSQAPNTGGNQDKADAGGAHSDAPFSSEGVAFLRNFIAKVEREPDSEKRDAAEVARFRLLANLVGSEGNDDQGVGVHDLNLLFTRGRDFSLGTREIATLVRGGLEHFKNENAPLWHWFVKNKGFEKHALPIYSLVGANEERRIGALSAMRMVGEPLHDDLKLERKVFQEYWFSKEASTALKVAAMEYLADCGITADLDFLHQQFDSGEKQIAPAAAQAIVAISLRDSREKAIRALYELQPTYIKPNLLRAVFDKEATISTELLMQGVNHQNTKVREIAIRILRQRQRLSNEISEKLLSDNDVCIRYHALLALIDAGRDFSLEQAKKILTTTTGSGLLSGISDPSGERYWKKFRRMRLQALSDDELKKAVDPGAIFDKDVEFVLAERHFAVAGAGLRRAIDDQYKSVFAEDIRKLEARIPNGGDVIAKTRELEEFTRKNHTRSALSIICAKGEPEDLGRVRKALKEDFLDIVDVDINYLASFGEWEDIPMIIAMTKRMRMGTATSLLAGPSTQPYAIAAKALYALGRSRLHELLAMEMPAGLLSQLVAAVPDDEFRQLSDKLILSLLRSEHDQVRKTISLKCACACNSERLSRILLAYIDGTDQHYYNVIHWLDFALSIPADRMLSIARDVLRHQASLD